MKLNEAMFLNEKNIYGIVEDYEGLRQAFVKALKIDPKKAESVVRTWLGGMEGVNSVAQLQKKLSEAGMFKNDKVDAAIIKIANSILADRLDKEQNLDMQKEKETSRNKNLSGIVPSGKIIPKGI
jgi:hypothetical protein